MSPDSQAPSLLPGPRFVLRMVEIGFAVVALFVAAPDWHRIAAGALLGAALTFGMARTPAPVEASVRWLVAIGLVVVTGGARSPLWPVLVASSFLHSLIFSRRVALLENAATIAAAVVVAVVRARAHVPGALCALMITPLLASAFLLGRWLRSVKEFMHRSAQAHHDEIVRSYEDRLRALQAMRGDMAHALKNPLASIKGLVGLMTRESAARVPERLDVLAAAVDRMQGIIEEYLSCARPLGPLTMVNVDVQDSLREVAMLHERIAASKQVTFDLSLAERAEIRADPQKLKQLLMSLVANAVDASECGRSVDLTCRPDGERVLIGVLDRGPGVPADLLPRLTVPGMTTKAHGSGLGLTVARALAEQHGGKLRLGNREGGGFAAEVELPITWQPPN